MKDVGGDHFYTTAEIGTTIPGVKGKLAAVEKVESKLYYGGLNKTS